MKDIIITTRRQRIELLTLAACFVVAFGLNVYAIVKYDGQWSELFWSLGFVVTATVAIYAAWTAVRIVAYLIKKIVKRKSR